MSYLRRIPIPHQQPDAYAEFVRSRQAMLVAYYRLLSTGHLSDSDVVQELSATHSAVRQLFELHQFHSKASI
jgi:hypothetical protein